MNTLLGVKFSLYTVVMQVGTCGLLDRNSLPSPDTVLWEIFIYFYQCMSDHSLPHMMDKNSNKPTDVLQEEIDDYENLLIFKQTKKKSKQAK